MWTLHRWAWSLASPLFVGATRSGALNRCRVYVPARALWGALTAELARDEAARDPAYRRIGDELREGMRLTYLYPAEMVSGAWRVWRPQYRTGEGLGWTREGESAAIPDRRFRQRLFGTRPATAVDPDNDSAANGSLRETECVQMRWRDDCGAAGGAVAVIGYAFIDDNAGLDQRIDKIKTLFIGGDARYGLGRLERTFMDPAQTVFGKPVQLHHPDPRVISACCLAHAQAGREMDPCGDQEILGGWDLTGQQPDRRISGPLWMPGSLTKRDVSWALLPNGTWRPST